MSCDLRDPVYSQLRLFCIVSLCVYGIGIPCLFAGIILYNRIAIRADQDLCAAGIGDTASDNPQLFVRRRYGKLYADFSSQCYYWKLVQRTKVGIITHTYVSSVRTCGLPH